jgi:hypothetical protein
MASGQLDEISAAIGRLSGQVEGIEHYIHEKRHDDKQVSMKIDGLGTRITRDIAAVEGRMEGRLKAMDDRVIVLEIERQREAGARSLALGVFRYGPMVITILTGLIVVIVVLIVNGRL